MTSGGTGPDGGLRRVAARAWRSTVAHNAAALYAVQLAGYAVQFATVPYLTRVLGPEEWGGVVIAQSFALGLALLLQYGFAFSATRRAARVRHSPARLEAVAAGVLGARLLLLGPAVAAGALAAGLVPVFRQAPPLFAWAALLALVQGFTPLWYFQGTERLRGVAALDVGARTAAAAAIFLLVRDPGDGPLVLAVQLAAACVSVGIPTLWLYREVALRLPRLRDAVATLRSGWTLFVFSGAASLYTTANPFVLGLLADPRTVGWFGSAEKLVRAGVGLVVPLSQALYPRVSHLVPRDPARAAGLVRRVLATLGVLGLVGGAVVALLAPWIARVAFGPGYEPAAPVLRVLALLGPVVAVGTVLGIHWALPVGLDRLFTRLVLAAGALNLLLAAILVPRWGATGMAVAAVAAEGLVAAGLAWRLLGPRAGRESLRAAPPAPAAEPPLYTRAGAG